MITPNGPVNNEEVNFTLTWSSHAGLQFNFAISPPVNGEDMWAVNESSTTLNLRKNTMYTVNISICPNMPYTSQFTVGN